MDIFLTKRFVTKSNKSIQQLRLAAVPCLSAASYKAETMVNPGEVSDLAGDVGAAEFHWQQPLNPQLDLGRDFLKALPSMSAP